MAQGGYLMLSKPLGTYLETIRVLNGIKPKEVAARANTYPNIIKKIMTGDTKLPGFEMVRLLVKAVQGNWFDVWWIQESDADEQTARTLAEARYAVDKGHTLTPAQREVMRRLMADPVVVAAVMAAIEVRRGSNSEY